MNTPALFFLLGAWFLFTTQALAVKISKHVDTISSKPQRGNSVAQYTSDDSFDRAKVHPINSTSWELSYFDAVAHDSNASLVIIFFTATSDAFAFLGDQPKVTSVAISGTFPNGTTFGPTAPIDAERAVITTGGCATGWNQRVICVATAPPHYPCGPATIGQNMQVAPGIGWDNAVPDANATVKFNIGGSPLEFQGVAYHDKNWSDQPFVDIVSTWQWGHSRFGPFSIVWFDFIGPNGKNYVSAYAAQNGKIMTASCSGIKVRPTGANATYPPTETSGNPGGFRVDIDLGAKGSLKVDITATLITATAPDVFNRWLGKAVGGMVGSTNWTGVAVFDQFRLSPG